MTSEDIAYRKKIKENAIETLNVSIRVLDEIQGHLMTTVRAGFGIEECISRMRAAIDTLRNE